VLSESELAKYDELQQVLCLRGCGQCGMVDEAAAHVRGFDGP